ncbi:MAG: hypothetical protein R3Y46_07545 [Opitutales bacterium]
MATKPTTTKDAKVSSKKCATKKACTKKTAETKAPKTCAKKESTPKACTTKKACAKKVEAKTCTKAPKACAKKETTPKACATKKACKRATKKTAINKELTESKTTIILAKTDLGWGNNLYIRGEGASLSWDKGVLMQSVSDNEWLWEAKGLKGSLVFKFLINDEIWCEGENIEGKINDIHTYFPEF